MASTKTTEVRDMMCTCCGERKKINSNNFYKSYSILFKNNYENRMCYCKECILKIADDFKNKFQSEERGLYELCKLLDVYYESALYESAKEQANKQNSNTYQIYFQKSLSLPQYKNKTFIDSDAFDMQKDYEGKLGETDRNIVDFWGDGFSERDYNFLEREFENLTTRYECDSYVQEMLFKEISFQTLDIRQKRQKGSDVSKELKTLQDLLGSANVKPAQENASVNAEQVTFGTLIKKYENEKPIPEPLSEWKSADWIKKYVCVWFFGNMCRMMGKPNPFQEEYEEEVNKYTVKPIEDDDDLNEEGD